MIYVTNSSYVNVWLCSLKLSLCHNYSSSLNVKHNSMVPMARIERATSPLPRECSTTELHGQTTICLLIKFGAGEGNRTLILSLEGFCSTIELHPPSFPVHQNWWRGLDSNQRRQSQQIYSLPPLTTRAPLRTEPYILIVYFYLVNQYL